jgi:hypothetical protein
MHQHQLNNSFGARSKARQRLGKDIEKQDLFYHMMEVTLMSVLLR